MIRLFVALDIESGIKESFGKIYDKFPNDLLNAKFVPTENLHITLKFIGEKPFDDVNDIIERLDGIRPLFKPFQMEFRGVGAFPNSSNPRIIWVGSHSSAAGGLAKEIDARLSDVGIEREKRQFTSHVTIARVKNVINRNDVKNIIENNADVALGIQNIDSFVLKKSKLTPSGPIYSNVEVFKL